MQRIQIKLCMIAQVLGLPMYKIMLLCADGTSPELAGISLFNATNPTPRWQSLAFLFLKKVSHHFQVLSLVLIFVLSNNEYAMKKHQSSCLRSLRHNNRFSRIFLADSQQLHISIYLYILFFYFEAVLVFVKNRTQYRSHIEVSIWLFQ